MTERRVSQDHWVRWFCDGHWALGVRRGGAVAAAFDSGQPSKAEPSHCTMAKAEHVDDRHAITVTRIASPSLDLMGSNQRSRSSH